MEIILKAANALRILEAQPVKSGVYRPSVYNFIVPSEDCFLIQNLFTKELLSLTPEEYTVLQGKTEIFSAKEVDELTAYLIRSFFLVPEQTEEQQDYLQFIELLQAMDKTKQISSYTVLTTTACNARCFYCFQQGAETISMTKETARDLSRYMIAHSGGEPLRIHWFGGEPLCNPAVMDEVSSALNEAGIRFTSHITSNGYAFAEEMIRRAVSLWHTQRVQITLDGMAEEHNRRKQFCVNDPDPFARVIRNIHLLLKYGIRVHVRINMDKNNTESVRELLPYLTEEFHGSSILSARVAVVFEECGSWYSNRSVEETRMLRAEAEACNQALIDGHFQIASCASNQYKFYACPANNVHHRSVNPEGKFLLCYDMSTSLSYGSIYEGITDAETYKKWMQNTEVREKCDGCMFLPKCTAFSHCPSVHSECKAENANALRRTVSESYRRYHRLNTEHKTQYDPMKN